MTRYNDRTYRVDDISFDMNPLSTFIVDGGEKSYVDYYKTNYDINITDKKQPLLLSIKKFKKYLENKVEETVICLVPEICFLTGLRDEARSNHNLMRELVTFTRVSPNQRLLALKKLYTNIRNNEEAYSILSNWGLRLEGEAEIVKGRLLDREKIILGKKTCEVDRQADFGKHVNNNELLDVVHLHKWLLVHCKQDNKEAHNFIEKMMRCTQAFGMKIDKPQIVVLNIDRIDQYVSTLRQTITAATQLVVCICPNSRDDRYAAIKRVCCLEIPVPSQVINAHTLSNPLKNRSIVQKIALQINCKIGGSLWSIKIPFKNTMICGIDVYHDPANQKDSVCAFVSSLNNFWTKWYSQTTMQNKREEICSGLCATVLSALYAYERENGEYPDRIIVFRDGVGDGQLQYCNNVEIPQIERACSLANGKTNILLTFIVVQKHINTRFFTKSAEKGAENPPPGSIIDSVITRSHLFDFFLVSQSVKHGAVSPTHYIVLLDNSKFTPDILQRLSYKMCFLYYNWPGTVRVPACCQYAHKLAQLVGMHIGRVPSEELATKLFFL